jgi:phospholipid/cholesterol/gamma-HCH transport system substrate-binding protein
MVKGKGLLGDSLIEISMGAKGKAVPASGFIRGVTPKGLSDLMSEGGEVVTKLKASLTRVEEILTQYSDPKLSSNLKGIIGSVNGIIGRVEKGPGLLHDLFYDKTLTRDVKRVVFQLQRLTANLASSVGQINRILAQARRRGTLVHSLLISRKSGRLAKQIRGLLYTTNQNMVALRDILRAPRKRGTLLYKVLHTKEAGKIVSDLTKASGNLRSIMDRINRGKGTLGAIINDPTAFEDFKTILGQVKRSRVFRTLIRFIIKRDDDVKGGRVVKP